MRLRRDLTGGGRHRFLIQIALQRHDSGTAYDVQWSPHSAVNARKEEEADRSNPFRPFPKMLAGRVINWSGTCNHKAYKYFALR